MIEFWFDQVYLLCAYCFSDSPQHHRENRFPKMFRHRIEHHAKLDKQVRALDKGFMEGMTVWYALIPNPRTPFCKSSNPVNSYLEAFIASLGH